MKITTTARCAFEKCAVGIVGPMKNILRFRMT